MHRLILTAVALSALVLSAQACSKQSTMPELQTTTGEQPVMQPAIVDGCLRRGLAENTFVLNASAPAGASENVTYALVGPAGLKLADYVGQRVEATGTIRAQEQVANMSGTIDEKPAKGTSGTPTVETTTELNMKRLAATDVKPIGGSCK